MGTTNYPLRLNGLSFSIKIGVLTNENDSSVSAHMEGNPVHGKMNITSINPKKRKK